MNLQTYQAPKDLLQQKIILITGASSGIGEQAAKTFAAHGATVILLGRNIKKLEQVYDDIITQDHPQPAIYPMNFEQAKPDDYTELGEQIAATFGHLDGVLHNAGILGSLTPIEHYDVKQWYQVMQTNLNAVFLLSQAVIPLLKKSPAASLLFTSSSVGRQARAYWGAYSVSKFGTEALMQILTQELENTPIRVNCINPKATQTKMRAKAYPAEDATQLPTPNDIMPAYLYLMGKDSLEVNGQSLDSRRQKAADR